LATFLFEVVSSDRSRLIAQGFDRHWQIEMGHHASLINYCRRLELMPKSVLITSRRLLGSIKAVIAHELVEIVVDVELFDVF